MDFDTRASLLEMEIKEDWEPKVKQMHRSNNYAIIEGLMYEYGTQAGFQKVFNFTEMGPAPFSIIAFHNKFLHQIRDAYTIGAFYPALTAACALGERILNQLILHLRDSFQSTSEYKKVYRKDSIDDWEVAISTLESWNVLLPEVASKFRELMQLRHRSLHFNPETDTNDHDLALGAVKKLSEIITGQFAAFGTQPWYFIAAGSTFVKRSQEKVPFVQRIVLPSCRLVGPLHTLESKRNVWLVHDDNTYEDREITDEEFSEMYSNRKI
jgi:hypothetical protein